MPELPEVETVRRQLAAALPGREIADVPRAEPFMLVEPGPTEFAAALPGRRIIAVGRRGKFLVLTLSDDLFLTIHLGMTGQLLVSSSAGPSADPHERYVFRLADPADGGPGSAAPGSPPAGGPAGASARSLVFRDPRKFGRVHLTPLRPPARLDAMGPDAWPGDSWSADDLAHMLRGRTTPLKSFLLDQRRLAGIGNIYADEILFAARLSPLRPAGSVGPRQVRRLAEQIRLRLDDGVRLRGCSISDFVDARGREGGFQSDLKAYGRQGAPCASCGRPLVRVVVAGRGTTYCPRCQR